MDRYHALDSDRFAYPNEHITLCEHYVLCTTIIKLQAANVMVFMVYVAVLAVIGKKKPVALRSINTFYTELYTQLCEVPVHNGCLQSILVQIVY